VALSITTDVCRSHGGKVPRRSREKAWKTIKKMTASGMTGTGLQVYVCSGCGLFFIGSALPREVKLRLRRQGRLRSAG
jgi:hypothetical protein